MIDLLFASRADGRVQTLIQPRPAALLRADIAAALASGLDCKRAAAFSMSGRRRQARIDIAIEPAKVREDSERERPSVRWRQYGNFKPSR